MRLVLAALVALLTVAPAAATEIVVQPDGSLLKATIVNESITALQGGAPWSVTGTFWQATQPVSGPLTDAQLRASAVPVSLGAPGTRINCVITSTATTSTKITGCDAPGAGQSIYITDIQYSSSIVSSTANVPTLQSGTGGSCGTATTVVWRGFMAAFTTIVVNLVTPIKLTANHELCFLHAGAGTRQVSVQGYIAP